MFLIYAPLFAMRFYPDFPSAEAASNANGNDALRIGAKLLGIYALLQAVDPTVTFFMSTWKSQTERFTSTDIDSLLRAAFYLLMAALLFFGTKRIRAIMNRIRYIPERDAYEPPPIEDATEATVDKSSP